jgi:hypothetical protein
MVSAKKAHLARINQGLLSSTNLALEALKKAKVANKEATKLKIAKKCPI